MKITEEMVDAAERAYALGDPNVEVYRSGLRDALEAVLPLIADACIKIADDQYTLALRGYPQDGGRAATARTIGIAIRDAFAVVATKEPGCYHD